MDPYLLRQLWSVIETSQSHVILSLDDSGLVNWLLEQLAHTAPYDPRQTSVLSDYIRSKTALIRDIVQN
ncbi:MAG: hypothetical protein AAF921_07665 [Cyanobacteria bacterium P01_D01_bin.44]